MMPILVKTDHVIRETNGNARHESQWLKRQLARRGGGGGGGEVCERVTIGFDFTPE